MDFPKQSILNNNGPAPSSRPQPSPQPSSESEESRSSTPRRESSVISDVSYSETLADAFLASARGLINIIVYNGESVPNWLNDYVSDLTVMISIDAAAADHFAVEYVLQNVELIAERLQIELPIETREDVMIESSLGTFYELLQAIDISSENLADMVVAAYDNYRFTRSTLDRPSHMRPRLRSSFGRFRDTRITQMTVPGLQFPRRSAEEEETETEETEEESTEDEALSSDLSSGE